MAMLSKKAPEINATSDKIDKIINRINSGDIKIPAFQRAYVWKQNQIIELLDSIVNNYPIGSILLWHSTEKLNHTRDVAGFKLPDFKEEYPVNYVLDGQQRISSIFGVFTSSVEQSELDSQYTPNIELFDIFYDFDKKQFFPKNEIDKDSTSIAYLRDFLNITKFIDVFTKLDKKYHDDAKKLHSQFINYELPVVTIKNRTTEEVGMIFERINNTGTKLGTLDLMTAWTWTGDFHLQEKTDQLFEELSDKGFSGLKKNILMQSLSGFIQNDATTRAITQLTGVEIRDNWDSFCEALKKSIDFLSTDLYCKNIDFLPYQQQIAGFVNFFSIKNETHDELILLKKWFWRGAFSNRYSSGMTTSKINDDIEFIKLVRTKNYKEAEVSLSNFKMNIQNNDFISTKFSKSNSLTRAVLLLMAQYSPKDLCSGSKVDINQSLSKYNRKEFHHVFPNAFLIRKGFEKSEIFAIVNFVFLSSSSNKTIRDKEPANYFFDSNIICQNEKNNILESNLLPLDKDIYQNNDYKKFQERRAELLLNEIKNKI